MTQPKARQTLSDSVIKAIQAKYPQGFLSVLPEDLVNYGKDWTRVFPPNPSAIVFPRSTAEVASFLAFCNENSIQVVPSGGRTGLSGGAVATQGEVVLSLVRMNRMGKLDTLAHTLEVEAGVVTEAVHERCHAENLTWPVDFASKGSSHVGGNIATNAGGVKVIRYGLTRNWILGLTAVTMEGQVLKLNGALEKNNTGLDLRHLLIGSEGVLAVITEATLKLVKNPESLDVFFFALEDIPAVLKLFHEVRRGPFQTMAFEFLTRNCLRVLDEIKSLRPPFSDLDSHQAYVLLEVERPESSNGQKLLDEWLAGLFERGLVHDGVLAQSPKEAKELWGLRENISESLAHRGFVHKNDIALPVASLESFIDDLKNYFSDQHSGFEVFIFGHIGDGNLHVNTMKPDKMDQDEFVKRCKKIDQGLFALIQKYRGSISAEHGIGLLKKDALGFSRTHEEIVLMKQIKKVFDPKGLLNLNIGP
ncbi:MAG: FAD-binding oxidoreductase [Bdellovibrio sp.]|nr:FAD-binding oxidoreductase [Bdellovibrio sp.]